MEPEKLKKHKVFLLNVAYYAVLFALLYVLFKFGLPLVAPFAIAFVAALLIRPAVDFLEKKWKFKRGLAAVVMVVLLYGVLGFLLILVGVRLVALVQELLVRLPAAYQTNIEPALASMFDGVQALLQRFDASRTLGFDQAAETLATKLGTLISGWSSQALSDTAKFAFTLPSRLVHLIFTVLATFYFAMDYKLISAFVLRQLPQRWATVLCRGKRQLGATLGRYIRAYGVILSITFVELCIALSILRVENAGWWALLIAFFDILPVVGTGIVMVPWAIVSFLQGSIGRGIGLAVTSAAIMVVRNLIEPKVVGTQVGLHPLVTLAAMFVGASLFGGFGLLGFPVTLALLTALQKEGTITFYKK